MLQIGYIVIMLSVITYKYMRRECTLSALILLSVFCPRILLGSFSINSIYIVVFYLILLITLRQGKITISSKRYIWGIRFTIMILIVLMLFLVSWIIMNRQDFHNVAASTLGQIRNVMLLLLICQMNCKVEYRDLDTEFSKGIFIVLFLNILTSVIQLVSTPIGKAIVYFRNDPLSNAFLEEVVKYGSFSRCFGIMSYPMMMGIFSVFAFAYYLQQSSNSKRKRFIGIIFTIFCAIFSASKTAWLGIVAVLAIYSVLSLYFNKQWKKNLAILTVSVSVFVMITVFYDQIGVIIGQYFGSNFAWYWSFLGNIGDAFASRYSSSEATALGYMPEFIKHYWLLGVGPASIQGELAIDSAFYIIIHHGGIIALLVVLVFYFRLLRYCWNNKLFLSYMLVICILITGFGFQTWLCEDINVWLMAYLFLITNRNNRGYPVNKQGKEQIC